ncbi:uncharacterized protein C8A04DRAFT_31228 [Dichotomopilus funicola]|uniref:Uncharacterized protein n=1 Tax=Dichotomopilus funicola TaxID=1934379 RepID=A0AAN6UY95_9PEZI|nr:hypothetical protein C8A04DRAFT_31228 [Dichotomopilus funicola]
MPHKPLRQLAAEKAHGNKPANPSQLGDPIDLKAETHDKDDSSGGYDIEINFRDSDVPDPGLGPSPGSNPSPPGKGQKNASGLVNVGSGAGPIGAVRKLGSRSKL